eukprot:scaffold6247_cov20-Tisochrysis_lutea.AAC.3
MCSLGHALKHAPKTKRALHTFPLPPGLPGCWRNPCWRTRWTGRPPGQRHCNVQQRQGNQAGQHRLLQGPAIDLAIALFASLVSQGEQGGGEFGGLQPRRLGAHGAYICNKIMPVALMCIYHASMMANMPAAQAHTHTPCECKLTFLWHGCSWGELPCRQGQPEAEAGHK